MENKYLIIGKKYQNKKAKKMEKRNESVRKLRNQSLRTGAPISELQNY